ncbi:MAG: tetratricopeptide repeat protein [Minisyncoccia bacterium]
MLKNIFDTKIKLILYSLVFLIPLFWLSFTFEFLEFNKIYLLLLFSTLGTLFWFYKMIFKEKKITFLKNKLNLFVFIFLFAMIVVSLLSKNKITSFYGYYGRFYPSLISTISLFLFYFLFLNNVEIKNEEKATQDNAINLNKKISLFKLLKILFISYFLVLLFTIFSLLILWNKLPANVLQFISKGIPNIVLNPVASSFYGLACFLTLMMVITISAFVFNKNKLFNIFLGILILLSFLLLIVINFNPSFLILFLSNLLFLVVAIKKKLLKIDNNKISLVTILMIFAFLFFLANLLGKNIVYQELSKRYLVAIPEITLDQKTNLNIAIKSLNDSPIFGTGLGNFIFSFIKYKPKEFLQGNLWNLRFDRGASYILELISTTGIIGTLSFILLLLAAFSFLIRRIKIDENSIPFVFGFITILFLQFFYYQNIVLEFMFWFLLGSLVLFSPKKEEKTINFIETPEIGLILSSLFWVFVVVIFIFAFQLGKLYLADLNYAKYVKNPNNNLNLLKKAVDLGDERAVYHLALSQDNFQRFLQEIQKNPKEINQQKIVEYAQTAIDEAKKATEREKNNVFAWENLGIIYRDVQNFVQGATDWAIKSFEKEIEIDPVNPAIFVELGKLKMQQKDYTAARNYFERALALKENYVPAQFQITLLDEMEGNKDLAKEKLEKLAEENPYDINIHFNLGRIYFSEEKYDEAIRQFQDILSFYPNHSNSLYLLGLCYMKKNDKDNALKAFQKVLELNPDNEDVISKINEIKGNEIKEENKK